MYGTVVFTTYKLKVTPISTVTAVQQDPFMLFYTLDEGTFIDGENTSLITLIGGRITLPISALSSLTTMAYLTDEVHTKYPMYTLHKQ